MFKKLFLFGLCLASSSSSLFAMQEDPEQGQRNALAKKDAGVEIKFSGPCIPSITEGKLSVSL